MQTASASIQKASGNLHKVNPTTAYHQGNQNVCNAMTTASVNTTTSPAHCCFNTATGMAPTSEGKAVIPINPAIADKTAQLRAQAVVSPTLSTASTNSASSISQPSTPTSIASTQQSQSASPSLDKETATSKGVCQDASQCAASEVVPFDVEAMIHETTQRGRRWSSPRNEMEAKRLCAICFALTKIGIQEGLVCDNISHSSVLFPVFSHIPQVSFLRFWLLIFLSFTAVVCMSYNAVLNVAHHC